MHTTCKDVPHNTYTACPDPSPPKQGIPKPNMTTRYTNEEWSKIIADVEKNVKVDESKRYAVPDIGSEEFTRTVDHTLLKLDSKSNQFDDLCAEARVNKFAVCL